MAALAAAALLSPWPAEFATALVAAVFGVSLAIFADAVRRPAQVRRQLPRWTFGLSIARIAAAVCVARAAAYAQRSPVMVALDSPQVAAAAAVAALSAGIAAILLVSSGAVRVAEVAARFALDSMPGRQLGLDAAVQSGAIGPESAAEGLGRIEAEASFYAAMDGAMRFLRAEAAGLVAMAAVAAGAGAALNRELWAAAVAFSLAGVCALLVATAASASACVAALTSLPGSSRRVPAGRQMRISAAVVVAVGAIVGLGDLLGGGPHAGAMLASVALVAVGATIGWLAQPRRGEALGGLIRVVAGPGGLFDEQLRETLRELRAALHARLGTDPGPIEFQEDPAGEDGAFRLIMRGLEVGHAWRCHGEAAVLGEGEDRAPDGRPMRWLHRGERADRAMTCAELVRWWAYRAAVASAELLFTADAAAEIAAQIAEATGAQLTGAADVLAVGRHVLARGLPLPPVELFADAFAAGGERSGRERLVAQMAVRTLLARAGEACLARQLHQDARQLLQEMAAGGFVGDHIEQLRQRVVEETWKRPDWRWPMLVIEGDLREVLERLLADRRAEVVVIHPDELPSGVGMPSVEVLECDST